MKADGTGSDNYCSVKKYLSDIKYKYTENSGCRCEDPEENLPDIKYHLVKPLNFV